MSLKQDEKEEEGDKKRDEEWYGVLGQRAANFKGEMKLFFVVKKRG